MTRTHHSLQRDALLTLPVAAGAVIRVEHGAIWFTVDTASGGAADIVLGRGQDYRLSESDTLLVQALAPCRFSVATTAARPALWSLRLRRFSAQLFGLA